MSGMDYIALGESPPLVNPFKTAAGVVGMLFVGAAGWAAQQFHRNTPFSIGGHAKVMSSSSLQTPNSQSAFTPRDGVESVVVKPGPMNTLALLPPGAVGPSALFLYSGEIPKELAGADSNVEAWIYGANRQIGASLAIPTGAIGDVLKGKLLTWSALNFPAKLKEADQLMGYIKGKAGPQRGNVNVVKEDGSVTKAYWYYLSTDTAAASTIAPGSDATALMRAAYENRYTWAPAFEGYEGKVIYEQGDRKVEGTFTVSADLKSDVQGVKDEEVKKAIASQLWEVTIHRVRRSFEQTHGENTFTVGDTNDVGTEIIVGGKNAGDRYRVKNNVVTMVYRHIHGTVVTIFTIAVTDTGAGYMSKSYTSQYTDPATNQPKGGLSKFTDTFVPLTPGGPWVLSKRVVEADGASQVFRFESLSPRTVSPGSDITAAFRRAYENRYTWEPDFPGYHGKCSYEKNNKKVEGTFSVSADLKSTIEGITDEEVKKAMSSQLWEVTIHRIRRTFEQTHGENTFTAGDTNEIGTEVIVGGKNAGDRYRIKDDVVTMVHRKIMGSIVTIFTESVTHTSKGYLSKKYSSEYKDAVTGEAKGGVSHFTDTFSTLPGGAWTLSERVIESAEGKQVFRFDHMALNTPVVPAAGSDITPLFRKAYENRYTWDPSFKGYKGKVTWTKGTDKMMGMFTVTSDFKSSVLGIIDEEVKKAISSQLWEVTIHRVRRTFEQTHGENTFTAGDTNAVGTEVIVGGKNAGDRYRIKNNVVTMVHRKIRDVIVTIYTESVAQTGEGYVSKKYDSEYVDAATGLPKGGKSVFTDTFVPLAGNGPWVLSDRIINENGATQTFHFSDLEPLDAGWEKQVDGK
eukprot:gb/GEZN01000529.1/.p1 GENE.gb/GEZN01000529.1/~~gb/GEZN01000529.1/.p1  ORF type:complete len:860 (-),score=82.54 gb/GEZN01000529.1/:1645-4200(-)